MHVVVGDVIGIALARPAPRALSIMSFAHFRSRYALSPTLTIQQPHIKKTQRVEILNSELNKKKRGEKPLTRLIPKSKKKNPQQH